MPAVAADDHPGDNVIGSQMGIDQPERIHAHFSDNRPLAQLAATGWN